MKTWIAVLAGGIIVAVNCGEVWFVAHQDERLDRCLVEAISRSPGPGLKEAGQTRDKDFPLVMEALSKQDTPFETAYLWLCSELPKSVTCWLPQVYPSMMIRLNAAAAVGRWGSAAKPAVPKLARLLTDDVADSNAALSLGLIGPDAKEAIPALISAVEERRPQAALALGKLGWAARAARPALEAACENGPEWQRRESRRALKLIGSSGS